MFVSLSLGVIASIVAARIGVLADFSYLLLQQKRSVIDLRAIEKRARVIGTALIAIESPDPAHREQAARTVRDRVLALGPRLVQSVTFDRHVERQYGWDHRWLFAELDDLVAARD